MKLAFVSAVICLLNGSAGGAFEDSPGGSSVIGMGGASTAISGCPWAAVENPGLLPLTGKPSISVSYVPGRFGLRELSSGAMLLQDHFSFATVALHALTFGFDLYREIVAGFSCGRKVADRLWVGAAFNLYSLTVKNYGNALAFGVDAGGVVAVSGNLQWGFSVRNLNGPAIGRDRERLPQVLRTGILVTPDPAVRIAIDVVKDIRFSAEPHLGVEFRPAEIVAVRIGASADPATFSAGLGVDSVPVTIDYDVTAHSVLGISHAFTVTFRPGEVL